MKRFLLLLLTVSATCYVISTGLDINSRFALLFFPKPHPFVAALERPMVQERDPFDAPETLAPPDSPPDKITIGPFVYNVSWRSKADMPHTLGMTDVDRLSIIIRVGEHGGELRETTLHEVMHACANIGHARNNLQPIDEDGFIESTAPALIMVLRDNPKLVEWLRER